MRRLLTAMLLLAWLPASAAGDLCAPRSWFWPSSSATAETKVEEATGAYRYWWCKSSDVWHLVHQVSLKGAETADIRARVEDVIRSAASPDAGVTLAFELLSNVPQIGTAARFEYDMLAFKACTAGWAAAPPGVKPRADWPGCVRPVAAVPSIVVGPATSADGTRPAYRFAGDVQGARVTPGAAAGQPCDASQSFKTTSAGTWAPFGPAFVPDVGTLCVKP